MTEQRESAHAKAFKAREPFSMTLDITGCYGHTGEPLPKVVVRVNSKAADNAAIEAAHVAASRRAKLSPELGAEGVQRLTNDPDFLTDMKTVEALWRAFLDAETPELPAWPSPEWMRDNLDSDQLAALLNLYEHVRQKRGPRPWDISENWIELIRDACAMSGDELPEMPLLGFSREYLAAFLVEAMRMWGRERERLMRTIAELAPVDPAGDQLDAGESTA